MKISRKITALTIFAFLYLVPFAISADETAYTEPSEAVLDIKDQKISLPLKSTLILALKNNLNIKFMSLTPQTAETDILREKGAFDILFSSQLLKTQSREQVANSLMGSESGATLFSDYVNFEGGLQKKFSAGTLAELKLTHQEAQSDLEFMGLNPEYTGEIALSLTQPLLKDFGISIGTSQIRIAKLNFESSENEFKKNVMDVLYQIESSYWDLAFRIADLVSKEKSLKRAEDLLREFKIRIEAGSLAPIEIYQAEAEVALRTQEVIVAKAQVEAAEDKLKSGLNLYEDEKFWNISIIPADKPVIEKNAQSLPDNIAVALEKRPDFKQAKLNLEASNIQVKYAKNQTLPRIDLIASVGTSGLAGSPQDTSSAFLPDFLGNLFPSDLSPWGGHWDDVYDGMAHGDYYQYSIGVKIEFPLENRIAKSQYNRARVQKIQSLTSIKNTENTIINEVRDAVRSVNTTIKVIDSAVASLRLANEKLKAEEKKYKVGMSTTHDILEFQEDLAMAESNLAFAQAEHRKAMANLARVKGILLEEKGLTL